MKDTVYFRHDYDSQTDPKMIKLISKHWWEWYWLFWAILECMRWEWEVVIYEKDLDAFAYRLHYERNAYVEFMHFCSDIWLLMYDADEKLYYSKRLQEDVEHMRSKSKKAKHSANARWKARSNANAMPTQSERNAIKERKVKESKVNNSKEKNIDNGNQKFSEKECLERFAEKSKLHLPQIQEALKWFVINRYSHKDIMSMKACELLWSKLWEIAKTDADAIEMLNEAIINNWKSVYPLKKQNTKRQDNQAIAMDEFKRKKEAQRLSSWQGFSSQFR